MYVALICVSFVLSLPLPLPLRTALHDEKRTVIRSFLPNALAEQLPQTARPFFLLCRTEPKCVGRARAHLPARGSGANNRDECPEYECRFGRGALSAPRRRVVGALNLMSILKRCQT
ncbi:hypothetical protein DFH11DRAFT_1571844 [Phellopilus nigrolimitatus]|nr:hypothetical protein DFH11DRAFT_1571844 [Phellopilus nigrolimitatus]